LLFSSNPLAASSCLALLRASWRQASWRQSWELEQVQAVLVLVEVEQAEAEAGTG